MKKVCFVIVSLFPLLAFTQNSLPQISNLKATYDQNLFRITISYDIVDAEEDSVEVILKISNDNGLSYRVDVSQAQGDLGYLATGTGKQIQWDAPSPIPSIIYRVKLIVDDRYQVPIQELVDQVDSARLHDDLKVIARKRNFEAQPLVNEEVKDSIDNRFQRFGLETRRQGGTHQGYQVENIIGRQEGISDDTTTYILDAHFDSRADNDGADDNASGIVGVLEAARILSQYSFSRSINFIGFDLEEEGVVGSAQYLGQGGVRAFENIVGVVNLEMIAYYDTTPNSQAVPPGFDLLYPSQYSRLQARDFRGDFLNNIAGAGNSELRLEFDSATLRYVPELDVISLNAPANISLAPDFWRSDHAPFWVSGIPALMITDGADFRNLNYHTPGDTLGTLDLDFMTLVVKATVGAMAELGGIRHSTEDTAGVTIFNVGLADLAQHCKWRFSTLEHAYELSFDNLDCLKGASSLRLFDIEGKQVYYEYFPTPKQQFRLSVKDLIPGIYLLSFTNEAGGLSRKIIVGD